MKETNILTEGSISKSLITLAIPIILANILQTAYQLTDAFWVGRLGNAAVAAISISFPFLFFIIALGGGLAMAGTILVAQYRGQGNRKKIDHISSQTVLVVFIISLILTAVGYYLTPYFVSLMHVAPEVAQKAISYLQISFLGTIFLFTFMVFQSLLRGVGEVKIPMYIVLGTVLLNLLLDPIFIFGYHSIPAFGVAGAALATVGTQGLAALIGTILLLRGRHQLRVYFKDLKPDLNLIKKMFKIGFPASIQQSSRALGIALITFLVASFGTVITAAYGIGVRVLSFVIIPAVGLSMATSTLVGQNIGAKKIDRAEKIAKLSTLIAFITLTLVGIIIFIFAKPIAAFFIPGEIVTIQISTLFIKIMALTFGFLGIQQVLNGVFRGSGNTLVSMGLSLISLWLLRLPIAYFLSKFTFLHEEGIWLAFAIANIVGAIISIIWFRRGKWKDKKIIDLASKFSVDQKIKQTIEEEVIEEPSN